MGGMIVRVVAVLALLGGGWLLGSFYPAPPQVKGLVAQGAGDVADRIDWNALKWEDLRARLQPEELAALSRSALESAVTSGEAILVERTDVDPNSVEAALVEAARAPAPAAAPAAAGKPETPAAAKVAQAPAAPAASAAIAGFPASLSLCPRMTVSNAPAAKNLLVTTYAPVVDVNGVAIATAPAKEACLSSSFGARNGRMHKGIDLHNAEGGVILAAGDGVVAEKKYRDDYGNMLLIDHGGGVYTRYAHLSAFARGLATGAQVKAGQEIGLMGNTASYRIPVHLHYEVLLGDLANPKGSFGLTPRSPFDFPAKS